MAKKRDPNGPGARLEAIHSLLCRGTGRIAMMIAVWRMDVDAIVEIEADVQRAAKAMTEFKDYMVELKRIKDAAIASTEKADGED